SSSSSSSSWGIVFEMTRNNQIGIGQSDYHSRKSVKQNIRQEVALRPDHDHDTTTTTTTTTTTNNNKTSPPIRQPFRLSAGVKVSTVIEKVRLPTEINSYTAVNKKLFQVKS